MNNHSGLSTATKHQNSEIVATHTSITIRGEIEPLAENPHAPNNNVKNRRASGFRLRVENWRVIYEINNGHLGIILLAIGSRGGIYK